MEAREINDWVPFANKISPVFTIEFLPNKTREENKQTFDDNEDLLNGL